MNKPVKVLIIEDSEDDAKLALRALRRGGFDPTYRRVQTAAELETALAEEHWDAVISDFQMPGFTGMDALRILRSTGLDIPFILISGKIGEDIAVEAMKAGASDYLMKASLARLAPALERELKETQMRAAHRQSQRDLIESEERFRSLTGMSSDFFWESDAEHRLTQGGSTSKKLSTVSVFRQGAQIGERRWEIPYLSPDEAGWRAHRAVLDAHLPFRDFELSRLGVDGTERHILINGDPLFDESGAFKGYRGVGKDITERKHVEEALHESEKRYRLLFEANPHPMWVYDLETLAFLQVNDAAVAHYGYRRDEFQAMTIADIRPADDVATLTADIGHIDIGAMDEGSVWRHRKKDGSIIDVEITAHTIDDGGRLARLVLVQDITERKRAELERQHRASELEESQRIARIGSWEWTIATGAVTWSDGMNHVLARGHGSPSPTFETLPQFYTPESWQRLGVVIARAIETGASYDLELEMICADGATCWTTTRGEAIRGANGTVVKLRGTVHDITETKRATESLRTSEAEFRTLAESMPQIVWITRPDGWNIYFNQQWMDYTGLTLEQSLGHGWNKPFHSDDQQRAWDAWQKAISTIGIYSVESRLRRADGIYRWWLIRGVPVKDAAGNILKWFGTCTDIHDLKTAELEISSANRDLRESERRFSDMLGNVDLVSLMRDVEGRITYCNEYLLRLTGWRYEEVIGRNWIELFIPAEMINEKKDVFAALLANRSEAWHHEHEILTRAGKRRLIHWNNSVLRSGAGDVIGTASIGEDITEQKRAEISVKRLNRVYAVLSGINTLIVRVRGRDELFKEACRIAVEQGGFRMSFIAIVDRSAMAIVPVASAGKDEALLTSIKGILSSSEGAPTTMTARAIREKKAVVSNDSQSDSQVLFGKKYAEAGVRSIAILPLIVSDEAVGALALYASEIEFFHEEELKLLAQLAGDIAFAIDHIEKQKRLDYLAYYDELTGLANRTLFLERVAQYMRSAVRGGHKLAVALIDLERFKNINDSLGRPAGDALLRQVAGWMTRITEDTSLLARVGADHFAGVLPKVKQGGDVARLLEKTMAAFLEHPFRLNNAVFRIAAKVGVAVFPDDGTDADTLFKHAEAALKKAKASGERYLFYTQKMTEAVAGKLTLENQLRQALDKGEFVLHYQPKGSFASGKLTGAEALIRWIDPRTGLVPPGRFIPILEETGLIYEVGRWALRQAIADYLRWRAAGLAAVRIAVNVSPLQLRHRGFIDEIRQAIGIDAQAAAGLELEITESLIMEDVKRNIASLQAIRALGVTIAIDDFGTGFSSLSYLAKLPVDALKIDRSFVTDMTAGPDGLALVSTIINLAHSLKLKVVAEGVETEEQSSLLRLLSCDEMQGFLFSEPVPAEIFETRFLAPPPAG